MRTSWETGVRVERGQVSKRRKIPLSYTSDYSAILFPSCPEHVELTVHDSPDARVQVDHSLTTTVHAGDAA